MKHAQVPAVWRGSRRWWLVLLVGVGIGQALLAVAGGIAVGRAFRALSRAPSASSEIWLLAVIVLASALGLAVLRAVERFLAEKVGQSYVHELRMRLLDHVLAGPVRDSTRRSVGGTALRFSSDLSAVRQWVSLGLSRLVVAVPLLVVALAFLAWLSVLIAVAAGIGVAVGMVAYGLLARRVRGSSRQARRLRGKMAAEVTELVARLGVVATHGAERREHNRIGRRSRMLRDAQVQRGFDIGSLRAASEIAAGVATSGCIVAAGLAGVAAHDVAAALIVLGALVVPLRDLGTVHEYRAGYVVAADRIAQVFARPVRSTDRRTEFVPEHGGRVELDRVGVGQVLDGVTLQLPAGSCAVVIGANGAGKSTLLGLVSGLVQPDAGHVTIDGVEVGRIHPDALRAVIGVVGPDLPLMRGSVGRNLRYRVPDASDDEVSRVLQLTGADRVVAELPQGIESTVGEAGGGLSSGQQTRIQLARAMLGAPTVLLLDEADAHIDTVSLAFLREAVATFPGTVVWATHRPDILELADVVWRVEDGTVSVEPVRVESRRLHPRGAAARR